MDFVTTAATMCRSLAAAATLEQPFRHWEPRSMLDGDVALALASMPMKAPSVDFSSGTRAANNDCRVFFNAEGQAGNPAMKALAEAFQSKEVVSAWEKLTGQSYAGCHARIEFCRDGDGFWLEPHTDIGAKRVTILIYLSTGPDSSTWGTDIYAGADQPRIPVPGDFNCGMAFVPGDNTWHGFDKRPISGLRRSLMLNYVGPEWRARHELCFPDQAV
jgi:hypothetical protein